MGREEAMDGNFRERFLALQRLEMTNPGYVCARRNADPGSTARPGSRRPMRTHCRTRAKVVKDADTLGAGA